MVIRTFKAKIVDDFENKWLKACAKNEGTDIADTITWYCGVELEDFSKRVSGKIVDLTENSYPEGENDYFEVIDNSFVIFPELFEEVDGI